MLGLYDSGLGGLTVLAALRAAGIDQDVVYFADQAHVPYGDRDEADLVRLAAANVAALEAAGVEAIVVGCNTSCAVAAKRGWPRASVPILDLIAAAAGDVVAHEPARVGVIATAATAGSGAYGRAIRARRPATDVQEVAAPALVPLVEAGIVRGPVAREAVRDAIAPLRLPLDVLVLACTHYPLLADHFAELLPGVTLLDPAVAQAARAVALVRARDAARPEGVGTGTGRTRYLTTGNEDAYRHALAETFAMLRPGDEVARVEHAVRT